MPMNELPDITDEELDALMPETDVEGLLE